MKYRELLNLYRHGQLEESQRQEVEAEIEKYDAISEYLCEESEIPSLEDLKAPADLPDAAESDRFTAAIQKSIRRAFLKLGITVGVVVLVVTLFAIFVLPRIVDEFYYQPDDIVATSPEDGSWGTNRMSLDLSVWTELFQPGSYHTNVSSVSRGYGAYDITIYQNLSIDGRFTSVGGRLVRNELMLYDPNLFRLPAGNAFLLPEGKDNVNTNFYVDEQTGEKHPFTREDERNHAFESLRRRPDTELLIAYISLEQITDYSDFFHWYENLELECFDTWVGIYAEDEYGQWRTENTGMDLNAVGTYLNWDREKYPALRLLDDTQDGWPDTSDEAMMTTHFLSLLSYLEDHPKMRDIFDVSYRLDPQIIKEYVQNNGLQVYGFALVTSRDELLKLEDDPTVSYISVTPY